MSDYHLTAIQDFGVYKRGDHIEDAAEVARILEGEHAVHVVKLVADDKPVEPRPAPAFVSQYAKDAAQN